MNRRALILIFRLALAGTWLLLFTASLPAAPIRVTTWNLQPSAASGTNGFAEPFQKSLLQEAAGTLKTLQPDVIILQQVADRETCNELAKLLRPEAYHVVACSSFRDPTAKTLSRGQVAILAKTRAYISWAEGWRAIGEATPPAGGFAFAAIRIGDKNAGFFSVQLSAATLTADREESARQLVRQIATLQNWTTNRLDNFIIAGDFNTALDDSIPPRETTLPQIEQAGFANAFAGMPPELRITLPGHGRRPDVTRDYIFTRGAAQIGKPTISLALGTLAEHAAVSCDVDLANPKTAPAPPTDAARAEPPSVKTPVAPATTTPGLSREALWWIAGILAVCATLSAGMRRLAHAKNPQPAAKPRLKVRVRAGAGVTTPASEQIVIAPPPGNPPYVHIEVVGSARAHSQTQQPRDGNLPEAVREGVIANLSLWLKQKFVRRLVSDRAELLATQQAAANKMLAVDERLTNIERQIKERNREYEDRIEVLMKELVAAKEENRELIRIKIAQVKAEMEREKLRVQEQRQGGSSGMDFKL